MKTFKKLILFNVIALVFTNSAFAMDNHALTKSDIENQLSEHITTVVAQIEQPTTHIELARDAQKLELSLRTNAIIADAKDSLPDNRFKVVIAD